MGDDVRSRTVDAQQDHRVGPVDRHLGIGSEVDDRDSRGEIGGRYPLLTGQYTVANTSLKQNGVTVPIAIALWASVSTDVDKKLSENLHLPIRLRPDEWRSGDVLWLIDAVGDPRAVPQLLRQLVETTFKGCEVKVRVQGENGKVIVQRIAETAAADGVIEKH